MDRSDLTKSTKGQTIRQTVPIQWSGRMNRSMNPIHPFQRLTSSNTNQTQKKGEKTDRKKIKVNNKREREREREERGEKDTHTDTYKKLERVGAAAAEQRY